MRRFATCLCTLITLAPTVLIASGPPAEPASESTSRPPSEPAAASIADRLDPPQGLFGDEWMVLELAGQKVGYAHHTMTRKGDEISTRTLTYMRIGRADQPVEISLMQSTRESLHGIARAFDSITQSGAVDMRTRGTIDKGVVTITSSQFGVENKRVVPFPEGARMAWGLYRAQLEHGLKTGTAYELDVYEPAMNSEKAIKTRVVVGDPVTIELMGRKRKAVRVTTSMKTFQGKMDSVAYLDPNGDTLKVEMSLAGIGVVMYVADKQTALADFTAPELFMDTLVRIRNPLDVHNLQSVTYRLRIKENERKLPALPDTAMQTVLKQSDHEITLRVTRIDRDTLTTPAAAPSAEFLAATAILNIDDPSVQKMAAEAAGDEARPLELAGRLRRYVTNEIKTKNLNVAFATAAEVCRRKEGDCTEHAVLLAALGRARKLPSRVVVGLVYVPAFHGAQNVFGFHMWTQFYIAGRWVDFDAAMAESDCSPGHIALATSSLRDAAIGDLAFAVIDVMTGLEITVETTKPIERQARKQALPRAGRPPG